MPLRSYAALDRPHRKEPPVPICQECEVGQPCHPCQWSEGGGVPAPGEPSEGGQVPQGPPRLTLGTGWPLSLAGGGLGNGHSLSLSCWAAPLLGAQRLSFSSSLSPLSPTPSRFDIQ